MAEISIRLTIDIHKYIALSSSIYFCKEYTNNNIGQILCPQKLINECNTITPGKTLRLVCICPQGFAFLPTVYYYMKANNIV